MPCDDLQENNLGNADFSKFTDGSYLKGDHGKYCAGYAIATLLDVLRQHLYQWLLQLQSLNYMILHKLILYPSTKSTKFILIVDTVLEKLMILECCGSNMAC